ncbi:NERD domain-containing protein, partial [Acinetobacter sp. ANC 5584]
LSEFLELVDRLQLEFQLRVEEYKKLKGEMNIGQVTAMIFGSLYAYENLIPHQDYIDKLPYQYDLNEKNSPEVVWKAFDEIVKSSNRNTKALTENSIALTLKQKMIPLITGEGLTDKLLEQYENFKRLIAIKIEILNFQRNVLESFSFDFSVNYTLDNHELIYTNKKLVKDYWSEKNSLLLNYWFMIGSQELINSDYIYRIINTGSNFESNAIALSKAYGIHEQVKQIYGIKELNINNVKLTLFDVLKTITLSQAHYLKDHIEKFEDFLDKTQNNLQAMSLLMLYGFSIGQNRMPIIYNWQKNKVKKMSSWIVEGDSYKKISQMNQILNFWSCDLYDEDDMSSIMQKPFYKIDQMIFQFPWLTAYQNLNTSVINYARKLHKNRADLKKETDGIEVNLGKKFQDSGFQVFTQYVPISGDAGEIDLIVIYDNHVLIVEIKSSYIRSSLKEIYEYRNFVLKKAAYQLTKKVEYIKSEFLPKYFDNPREVQMHSWIIDTSLEFDHEYFDGHLKLSLDEVIIRLSNHEDYMGEIFDGDFISQSKSNSLDKIEFFRSTELNEFWEKQLKSYSSYIDQMSDKIKKSKFN